MIYNRVVIKERMITYCLLCQLRNVKRSILGGGHIEIQCELKVNQITEQRQRKQSFETDYKIGALKTVFDFEVTNSCWNRYFCVSYYHKKLWEKKNL